MLSGVDVTHGGLGKKVWDATPKPTCSDGHAIDRGGRLERVDLVVWAEYDEWLT